MRVLRGPRGKLNRATFKFLTWGSVYYWNSGVEFYIFEGFFVEGHVE